MTRAHIWQRLSTARRIHLILTGRLLRGTCSAERVARNAARIERYKDILFRGY